MCELNIKHQIESILRCSDILEDMTQAKDIGIVGAVYDIATGEVRFWKTLLSVYKYRRIAKLVMKKVAVCHLFSFAS